MTAYYNEIDPYAAQWLRNLIAAGQIAPGDVDERSIHDVSGDDLRGYAQAHFFAGIGGWSYALRLAGWDDARPVWTGSCPCQPFSAAGQGKAADDERHLWPDWFRLIRAARPPVIFGEQVEAAIGWGWLDLVHADLGEEGYATGFAVLPAASVGAPHIRQRLWFVADAKPQYDRSGTSGPRRRAEPSDGRADGELADACGLDLAASSVEGRPPVVAAEPSGEEHRSTIPMADADRAGQCEQRGSGLFDGERAALRNDANGRGIVCGMVDAAGEQVGLPGRARQSRSAHWQDAEFIPCTDGKARPVEPGTFPLAHGIPGRVGRLRAYGNAIVPQAAAEFIKACEG